MAIDDLTGASRTFEQRFWKKVEKRGGCWEWIGYRERGYGKIHLGRGLGMIRAHRASYVLHYGPVDPRLLVMHECDNKGCVRPGHLKAGTTLENMRDVRLRGRRSRVKPRRDATPTEREMVLHLRREGWALNEIAAATSLSAASARYIQDRA